MDPTKLISLEERQKLLQDENIPEPVRELLFYLLQKDEAIFDILRFEKQQFGKLLALLEKKNILSTEDVKEFTPHTEDKPQ